MLPHRTRRILICSFLNPLVCLSHSHDTAYACRIFRRTSLATAFVAFRSLGVALTKTVTNLLPPCSRNFLCEPPVHDCSTIDQPHFAASRSTVWSSSLARVIARLGT